MIQGQANLEKNKQKELLEGPVLYHFDSGQGVKGPLTLKQVPDWVNPAEQQPLRIQRLQTAVETLRRAIAEQGVPAGILKAQQSKDVSLHIVAAYSGVALDKPASGIQALSDAKAKEVRVAGATALRHYIGRGSAQDVGLYEALLGAKLKSGQASIIMELLHGFSPKARERPETYDLLISYLQSDQLPIRQLAGATLAELAPEGKSIPYDAAGSTAERHRRAGGVEKTDPARAGAQDGELNLRTGVLIVLSSSPPGLTRWDDGWPAKLRWAIPRHQPEA